MRIKRLAALSPNLRAKILARGTGAVSPAVRTTVKKIIADVKKRGAAAVLEATARFDGVQLPALEVSVAELAAVDVSEFQFLTEAAANIERFNREQLLHAQSEPAVETKPGIRVWRTWRPIERVGIYAPGGKATYPSSVLMQAIPARIAGCHEIILATPPRKDGTLAPVVLAAAKIAGVTKIIKAGGGQAIAALHYVYGAEKLTGPGNLFVTEAKAQLSSRVAIDMPAGPSEVLVLADETATPRFVAADLLSQAEHAADSSAILVTTSRKLAKAVATEIDAQLTTLARRELAASSIDNNSWILVADTLDEAIDFTNAYAPEHLEIVTKDDAVVLAKIVNAGSVFLGSYASEPAGDFATGSNHVLPTAGFARNFGALSVESFGKKIQVQSVTRDGLASIRGVCEEFGRLEGLSAHARSISIRFE